MGATGARRTDGKVYAFEPEDGCQIHVDRGVKYLENISRTYQHRIFLIADNIDRFNYRLSGAIISIDDADLIFVVIILVDGRMMQRFRSGEVCIFALFRKHNPGTTIKDTF